METGSISDFGFEMYDLVKRIVIAGLEILRYWFGITNPEQRRLYSFNSAGSELYSGDASFCQQDGNG